MSAPARVAVVIGTRPEAIKLASVVWALHAHPDLTPVVISTGQHRELLAPVLDDLALSPDHLLDTMTASGDLCGLTARLMDGLGPLLAGADLDAVVVQGDTTSALCAALAAFYARIPVAHVEAGLRSGDPHDPFPEELNRKMITVAARWHFAPTHHAADRLHAEGVNPDSVLVTGNTVIDTLAWARQDDRGTSSFDTGRVRPRVLVTLHRRESQGPTMAALGRAVAEVSARSGADVVLPLHRSPAVRSALVPTLAGRAGIQLCEPLGYFDFLATLADADLLLTDSGGALEEAAALGVPTLVCRETTERPEALQAGTARLVGTDARRVADQAVALLDDRADRAAMANAPCPFGDGHAGAHIATRLAHDITDSFQASPPTDVGTDNASFAAAAADGNGTTYISKAGPRGNQTRIAASTGVTANGFVATIPRSSGPLAAGDQMVTRLNNTPAGSAPPGTPSSDPGTTIAGPAPVIEPGSADPQPMTKR